VPGGRIDGTVGVADQRAKRTRLWPPFGGVEQRIDAARPPLHVGVRDDEELGVRVEQAVGDRTVDRGAVAEVGTGAEEPDVRVPLHRLLWRAVGGSVVRHDDPHRPIGGVRQRREEAVEVRAR
jgi:hypothetical protein